MFISEALWILENKEEAQVKKLKNFYEAQLEVNMNQYSSTTISNLIFPLDVFRQKNPDWRNLYYSIKFNIPCEEAPKLRENLVNDYIQALVWIWVYYTTGIKSWSWYYPHHHAPLLSEFCDKTLQVSLKPFSLGAPLKPFVQLMAVMPKSSLHCLPDFLREMACKEDSPLAHLYPKKFHRDADCSDANWKAVPLIPFMDISLLEKIVKPVIAETKNNGKLTDEEKKRNSFGHAIMYFHSSNKKLLDHYKAVKKNGSVAKRSFKLSLDSRHMIRLDNNEAATVTAYLYAISKKHILGPILPKIGKAYNGPEDLVPNYFKKIEKNYVLSAVFYSPVFEVKHFYLLPSIDKSKAHDFSQFEEREFRISQNKLGRSVAILHSKDCRERNSLAEYGDGYGTNSRFQKNEKVITAPINKRSLSERDYAKRNRGEQIYGNYSAAYGSRSRQAPENNNAKRSRWEKPFGNYPAKRARVESQAPNKKKRFN
jgi:5'-3' exonuclease